MGGQEEIHALRVEKISERFPGNTAASFDWVLKDEEIK